MANMMGKEKFCLYDFKKNEKNNQTKDMYNDDEKREINDEININKDKIIHCEYCQRIKKIVKSK